MKFQNVKVTTTSGFDGIEIKEYLEPVTAHVVVGMNFFKDFFTGFTDFFGGRSTSYQETLNSINDTVINELRKKAHSIGGNCILGLKIDNDEISAQGKSMMMVTALGTVAKANFPNNSIVLPENTKAKKISQELFDIQKQKHRYIIDSTNNLLKVDDELWEFVKKNKVSELSQYLFNNLFAKTIYENNIFHNHNHLCEYFSLIDSEIVTSLLYDRLLQEEDKEFREEIIKIISELQLIDYERITDLINSQSLPVRKSGIQLLKGEKLSYAVSDIQQIESLINLISITFKEKEITSVMDKEFLALTAKKTWICQCGRKNTDEYKYCKSCKEDTYGFYYNEVNPKEILIKLVNDLEVLKFTLG